MTPGKLPAEVLFDSETSLRLADHLVADLTGDARGSMAAPRLAQELHDDSRAAAAPDQAQLLEQAAVELESIVEALRNARDGAGADTGSAESRLEASLSLMRDLEVRLDSLLGLLSGSAPASS